jgi:hypothetical protein
MANSTIQPSAKDFGSTASPAALFIDGAILRESAQLHIDFKRLRSEFEGSGTLLRAHYCTTIMEDEELDSLRPLTDWLDYNGYCVTTKAAEEFDGGAAAGRSSGTSVSSSASML